jgi:stage II sporulation protein D
MNVNYAIPVLFLVGCLLAVFLHQGEIPHHQYIINLKLHDSDEMIELELEEYLLGVVAAEMPAKFHLEALKAQAIAARTYALHVISQEQSKNPGSKNVISSDFRVNQAWISKEDFWKLWGEKEAQWRWARIESAVYATSGLVITYQKQPILAAYHASSGGHTEDSENYWVGMQPYLRGVEDSYDHHSPYYDQVTSFTFTALANTFPAVAVSGPYKNTVEILERFSSGRVKSVRIGNQIYTGRQVREQLNLKSSLFDVRAQGDRVEIVIQGSGHGIGLSQYGAEGMAQEGFTYEDIIKHYYTGVEIVRWY